MIKVKCITPYFDKILNKSITTDDEPFEVSEERAKKLIEAKVCEIVETKKEKPVEENQEDLKQNKSDKSRRKK